MHGLILIDKPAGVSSHDVVRQVRRICRTRKVGHAGTLDPLATGVLPVAVGDGTKILQFLFRDEKSYRATMQLGISTDTLDSEGQKTSVRSFAEVTCRSLESACSTFRGEIMQIPPMYSALKKNGVPLYKLARAGEVVEREPRPVTISRLDVIHVDFPVVTIDVDCTKGTYIRTLIDDIGEALGCGAHMTGLRRTRSGLFSIDQCVSLQQLEEQILTGRVNCLLSLDEALAEHPAGKLQGTAVSGLRCGIPPTIEQVATDVTLVPGTLVRLQIEGELAAMVRYAPERINEKRGDFELIRVFCAQ